MDTPHELPYTGFVPGAEQLTGEAKHYLFNARRGTLPNGLYALGGYEELEVDEYGAVVWRLFKGTRTGEYQWVWRLNHDSRAS